MKAEEVKNELNKLKDINPDVGFCSSSRQRITSYALLNKPQKEEVKSSINWGYWFQPVAVGLVVLIAVLGSKTLLSPSQPGQQIEIEVSSIKNSWKLADISPYIEEIFEDKIVEEGNKKVSLDLVKGNTGGNAFDSRMNNSVDFNLGITDVDRAIDSLTF